MTFLFASWHIPNINKEAALDEILKIEEKYWFYEPYRHTHMLPMMTKDGKIGFNGTSNLRHGELKWVDYACPTIKSYCEQILFPLLGMNTRIVILRTAPDSANYEHIDCSPEWQFSRQHKFRIVLQGKTDSLYFIKKSGKHFVPDIDTPFLMDGSWPHGMINNYNRYKYTLVAGSPWHGLDHYNNLNVLMVRDNNEIPIDYEKYYQKN